MEGVLDLSRVFQLLHFTLENEYPPELLLSICWQSLLRDKLNNNINKINYIG